MIKLIWIAIDVSDGEPILSANSEKELLEKLDEWSGVNKGSCTKTQDRQITYDGEYIGNLERVVSYEDSVLGGIFKVTYNIWCIEL